MMAKKKNYSFSVPQMPGSFGLSDNAGFYDADFSKSFQYYSLSYIGPDLPWQRLEKVHDGGSGFFIDNPSLSRKSFYETHKAPIFNYTTIPNDNGDVLNVKMIFPADFDSTAEYPVLMLVYGGPGSQTAGMEYKIDFMHRITVNGIISVIVDGRGTGFKGRVFRNAVSKRLGYFETEDQIQAARYLSSLPYVDEKNIGIWGWSFGGFLTLKALEKDDDIIKFGMAVAPVSDWKYYDTVYTERFMKTPEMNRDGYRESAINNMEGFEEKPLLLIHGTADDNVHFQNSAEMVWQLTGAGITGYTTQFYTDSDHSIMENGAYTAVFSKLENFACEQFGLESLFTSF